MYLWFEDWSQFLFQLDDRGISHGDKIIKVKAGREHPGSKYGRDSFAVLEIDDQPFRQFEVFNYGNRGSWRGTDFEMTLQSLRLDQEEQATARTLFRFANLPQIQACRAGMKLHKPDGSWLIMHPLEDIDGIGQLLTCPERGLMSPLHLDIFVPESITRVLEYIRYGKNPEALLTLREAIACNRKRKEG